MAAVIAQMDRSVEFIRKNYRFASQAEQAVALGRFGEARERFKN
jgi:hypothetical protein